MLVSSLCSFLFFFFFKQKTAYEMRISDWSSDVCSSDLFAELLLADRAGGRSARHYFRHAVRQLFDDARATAVQADRAGHLVSAEVAEPGDYPDQPED